jgi:hypothetical protein
MRKRNWFIGVFTAVFRRHLINLYVRKKNSEVEQKKERRPKVDTATKPCDNTSGRGDNVLLSASRVMAASVG